MTNEHYREHLSEDLKDQILKEYTQFNRFKERYKLGFSHLTVKEALAHEYTILNDLIDISQPVHVMSHRPTYGKYIVKAKKFLMKIMKPVIRITMLRQILLNEYLVNSYHLVKSLEARVDRLEREHRILLKRLEKHR